MVGIFTVDSLPTGKSLWITEAPPGYEAQIGSYGTTPKTWTTLGVGHYQFAVYVAYAEKPALQDTFYDIDIVDGDNGSVLLDLSTGLPVIEGQGILSVNSIPTGASVFIDGTDIGVTPLVINLDEGSYTLDITLDGYAPWQSQVTIVADQQTTINATLTQIPSDTETIGNTTQYGSENNISDYARTNWFDLVQSGIPYSVSAYVNVIEGPAIVRCGIYEYISPSQAGALLAQTEEITLPAGFSGLQSFLITGQQIVVPAGRVHVMINSYGDGQVNIYRGAWTDGSWTGVMDWWGVVGWPDGSDLMQEQGAPMSIYMDYIPTGEPEPVNPRTQSMYFSPAEINEMQNRLPDADFDRVQVWCDAHVNDLFWVPSTTSVWREWMDWSIAVSKFLHNMGFMYWMTDDETYAEAAARWFLSIPNVPDNQWFPGHWQVCSNMARAYAAGYDMLHEYLSIYQLQLMRNEIVNRLSSFVSSYSYQEWRYPNHTSQLTSIGILGYALGDDFISSGDWITRGFEHLNGVLPHLQDGAYEGPGYAGYSLSGVVPFIDIIERKGDGNRITGPLAGLENMIYYCIYMNYNGTKLSMEDSTNGLPWNETDGGLAWMNWLAARFNNGYGQTWIDAVDPDGNWYTYFQWKSPTVVPLPINELPTRRLFGQLGYLIYRSAWGPLMSGDNNLVIIFKSGTSAYHAHPDQNSYSVWMKGAMISGGPGYVTGQTQWDQTRCHNCILFINPAEKPDPPDGFGQAQEPGDIGTVDFGVRGIIEQVELKSGHTYVRGNATAPYAGISGITGSTVLAEPIGPENEPEFMPIIRVPAGQADALKFPASNWTTPSFYLKIDDEYFFCSGRDGDSCYAAERGLFGTEPVAHATGAPVGLYYYDLESAKLTRCVRHLVIMDSPSYFVVLDDVVAPVEGIFEYCLQGNGGSFSQVEDMFTLNHNINLNMAVIEPPGDTEVVTNTRYVKYPSLRLKSDLLDKVNYLTVSFPDYAPLPMTEINQGNLLGVQIETDAEHIDLILFSADGQPVSEWVQLDDSYESDDGNFYPFAGNTVGVQFTNYAVMRLVKAGAAPRNLSVTSVPTGANVYLNDELMGVTPLSLYLAEGTYTVKVTHSGYPGWFTDVDILPDQLTEINAVLGGGTSQASFASIAAIPVIVGLIAATRNKGG